MTSFLTSTRNRITSLPLFASPIREDTIEYSNLPLIQKGSDLPSSSSPSMYYEYHQEYHGNLNETFDELVSDKSGDDHVHDFENPVDFEAVIHEFDQFEDSQNTLTHVRFDSHSVPLSLLTSKYNTSSEDSIRHTEYFGIPPRNFQHITPSTQSSNPIYIQQTFQVEQQQIQRHEHQEYCQQQQQQQQQQQLNPVEIETIVDDDDLIDFDSFFDSKICIAIPTDTPSKQLQQQQPKPSITTSPILIVINHDSNILTPPPKPVLINQTNKSSKQLTLPLQEKLDKENINPNIMVSDQNDKPNQNYIKPSSKNALEKQILNIGQKRQFEARESAEKISDYPTQPAAPLHISNRKSQKLAQKLGFRFEAQQLQQQQKQENTTNDSITSKIEEEKLQVHQELFSFPEQSLQSLNNLQQQYFSSI